MPKIILKINQNNDVIAKGDNISCYIADSSLDKAKFSEITATGKMVLAQGEKAEDCCKMYNLDGVVVEIDATKPVKAQLKPWREKFKNKTLGAVIPPRRHEAMLASEVEPEFVAFKLNEAEDDESLIEWYNELFVLPSAVLFKGKTPPLEQIKSDFVIIDAEKFENSGC